MGRKSDIKITNVQKSKNNIFTEAERKYRQEASQKVSMANKRLKRLEQQNLVMSPAFKKWIDDGKQKFGIKGKSMDEVRVEVARLNKFLKQVTSTVAGTKQYLANIAGQVGIKKWGSFQDLNAQLQGFFDVADRVQEYLKNSKEVAVSIGYKKVWEQVSEFAETTGKGFLSLNDDIVDIANTILQANSYSKLDDLTDDFLKSFIDQ